MRITLASVVLLMACGAESPSGAASTVRMVGQASWGSACPAGMMASCPPAAHRVSGTAGVPGADIWCEVTHAPGEGGGYSVAFRIASLGVNQQIFDESDEGLAVEGYLPAIGQELRGRSSPGDARAGLRGPGWGILSRLGPSEPCHVFVDVLSERGFSGRISCDNAPDNLTPPRQRIIRGVLGEASGAFGFTGCAGIR